LLERGADGSRLGMRAPRDDFVESAIVELFVPYRLSDCFETLPRRCRFHKAMRGDRAVPAYATLLALTKPKPRLLPLRDRACHGRQRLEPSLTTQRITEGKRSSLRVRLAVAVFLFSCVRVHHLSSRRW
jgi:hypothetical protein